MNLGWTCLRNPEWLVDRCAIANMQSDKMEDVYEGPDECAEALSTPIPHKKARAMSDTPPVLLPSPVFHEPARTSKDDIAVMPSTNATPQRPQMMRGLSLQVPGHGSSTPSGLSIVKRVPLSPKVDASFVYGSPTSVLPRRSRGIDFSRACTNLHHSTLADHSSPDSSPTLSARPSAVSHRRGFHHPWHSFGSPHHAGLPSWSTHGPRRVTARLMTPRFSRCWVAMACPPSSLSPPDDRRRSSAPIDKLPLRRLRPFRGTSRVR